MRLKIKTIALLLGILFNLYCNKQNVKIKEISIPEFYLYDENNYLDYYYTEDYDLKYNMTICIDNTDYCSNKQLNENSDPQVLNQYKIVFKNIWIDKNKSYTFRFQGDGVGTFLLCNQYLSDTYKMPFVKLTKKSSAIITNLKIDEATKYSYDLNGNYFKLYIEISGHVSQQPNSPLRSFCIYLDNYNPSSTEYDCVIIPKLSQTDKFHYDSTGYFTYKDTVRLKSSIQDWEYGYNSIIAVAYGKAGLSIYDQNFPYFVKSQFTNELIPAYGFFYDLYKDPITGDTIDPGLGEPSNIYQYDFSKLNK
mgnify:CR=1 FL=1